MVLQLLEEHIKVSIKRRILQLNSKREEIQSTYNLQAYIMKHELIEHHKRYLAKET